MKVLKKCENKNLIFSLCPGSGWERLTLHIPNHLIDLGRRIGDFVSGNAPEIFQEKRCGNELPLPSFTSCGNNAVMITITSPNFQV